MPIDLNHNLHTWIKAYRKAQSIKGMPDGPDEHDLFGFPGVKAQPPYIYIRKLCLAAEDVHKRYPVFYDIGVHELARCINKLVNEYVKSDEKRCEVLAGRACPFLEAEAVKLLRHQEFGPLIWGENNRAEVRFAVPPNTSRPRWGAKTDSGRYEVNDEEEITLNLRYWMASRIHTEINAPCKDKIQGVKRRTKRAKKTRQPSCRKRKAPTHPRDSLKLSNDTVVLSESPEHHTVAGEASVRDESHPTLKDPDHGALPDGNSDQSCSFERFACEESQTDPLQSEQDQVLRSWWADDSSHQLPQHFAVQGKSSSIASVPMLETINSENPPSGRSTITTSSTHDSDIEDFKLCEAKQKLQRLLTSFLTSKEPEYHDVLENVIPSAKEVYGRSPQSHPHHDLYMQFRDFNVTLDHWKTFINRYHGSADATRYNFDNLLHQISLQTPGDRLAAHRQVRSESQSCLSLDRWAIGLATYFEALLGQDFMPFSFVELVKKLRIANQPLCNSFSLTSDEREG